MANGGYSTVRQCRSRTKDDPQIRHKREIQLLPAVGPLEFVAMDILELLPKKMDGNLFVIVISDGHSK